jgi:hypothetical protein
MDGVGGHKYFMKYQFGLLAGVLQVVHSTIPIFDKKYSSQAFLPGYPFLKGQV